MVSTVNSPQSTQCKVIFQGPALRKGTPVASVTSGHTPATNTRIACRVLTQRIPSTRHRLQISASSGEAETTTAPKATYKCVDEEAMLAESTFPIKPDELIAKAKEMMEAGLEDNPQFISAQFQFIAPVVGPMSRGPFLKAIGGFALEDGFPDLEFNFHHFRVDPFEPNRVWFTSRMKGTNTGKMASLEPTGKYVEKPPENYSLTFAEDGLIDKLTLGYVMDRDIGNSGGLGGIFGIFYAIGKPLPFPEANPRQKSIRFRLFDALSNFVSRD